MATAFLAALMTSGPVIASSPERADLLQISPAQLQALRIQFAVAEAARDHLIATLPAVIAPSLNARIAVAATFPGTVLSIAAVEGSAVRQGQPLAVIASREILSLAAELAGARARLSVAEANAKRQSLLVAEGIVAGARAEEADAARQEARADVGAKSRVLAAVSADGSRGTYTLISPIDGTVSAARLQAGEPVDGMTAAFVVDASDRFELHAQVPERLIGRIAPGMRVLLDGTVAAVVTSVGSVVQPETRSATLRAAIADGAGLVAGRAGMAAVYAPVAAGAVRIPRGALADLGGQATVFVRTADGVLVRKVTTAAASGTEVVVLTGLRQGEEAAISGLSELKSIVLGR